MSEGPITSYRFGEIGINGQTYKNDVLIMPDKVKDNWWRREGHRLAAVDLAEVFVNKPRVLIVGTGWTGLMKIAPEVSELCRRLNCELLVAKTAEACRLFNELKNRDGAVAALHLTC